MIDHLIQCKTFEIAGHLAGYLSLRWEHWISLGGHDLSGWYFC